MKIVEKGTDWDAEVNFFINGVGPVDEYDQYFDKKKRIVGCFVGVEEHEKIMIQSSFHGTAKRIHADVFIDGVCRKAAVYSAKPEANAKNHTTKFNFNKFLYNLSTGVIDTDVSIVLIPSHIQFVEGAEETLGTVELQLSVEREAGEEHPIFDATMYYDESESVREKQKTVGYKSLAPEFQTTFDPEFAPLALRDANKNLKTIQAKRPGLEVWATFQFHYRSKQAIEDNGLPLTYDANAKGKAKFKIPICQFAIDDDGSGSVSGDTSLTRQSTRAPSVTSTLIGGNGKGKDSLAASSSRQTPTQRATSDPPKMATLAAPNGAGNSALHLFKELDGHENELSDGAKTETSAFNPAFEAIQQSSAADIVVDSLPAPVDDMADHTTEAVDGLKDQAVGDEQLNGGAATAKGTGLDEALKKSSEGTEINQHGASNGGDHELEEEANGQLREHAMKNDIPVGDTVPKTNSVATNDHTDEDVVPTSNFGSAKQSDLVIANGVGKATNGSTNKSNLGTTKGNSKPAKTSSTEKAAAAEKTKATTKTNTPKAAPKPKEATQTKTPKKGNKPAAATTTPKASSKGASTKRAIEAAASGTPNAKKTKPTPTSTATFSSEPASTSTSARPTPIPVPAYTPMCPSPSPSQTSSTLIAVQLAQARLQLANEKRKNEDIAKKQEEVNERLANADEEKMMRALEKVQRESEELGRRNREGAETLREMERLLEEVEGMD
ncbi:hypothetical protein P154DRAFT_566888 [Amniculicola lignicola CBS 123094]|uniref:Uncharacterized protein n=1 Tax=Amniculicola lignicola CBS 123094 TaxID=1392246 RepID=A0A6A5W097_9PLEO|nr:hypothetical protein P154DRAFT_566888 [Amniculicola lignicola CBS 123094]